MMSSVHIRCLRAAALVVAVAATAFSASAKKPPAEWRDPGSQVSPSDLLEGADPGAARASPPAGSSSSKVGLPPGVAGSFDGCPQFFPPNFSLKLVPTPRSWHPGRLRALCFSDFAALYSGQTRTPVMVFERLTASILMQAQTQERAAAFYAEARVPSADRASLEDYAGSGFDRGHMAPSADFASPEGRAQSNSLANVVPQDPEMNRGPWLQIEKAVRKYALRRGEAPVWVVTGPVFDPSVPRFIGLNDRVRVPSQIYKRVIVIYPSPRSWVHLLDNARDSKISPPIEAPKFEAMTGVRFSY